MLTEFRRGGTQDLAGMVAIIDGAKAFLRSQGLDQWQRGEPGAAELSADIEAGNAYVLTADGRLAATLALVFGEDDDYRSIQNGAWASGVPYAAMHRVALADTVRGSGLGGVLMDEVFALCRRANLRWMRGDTHPGNLPMQRFLQKHGFVRRGEIVLTGGAEKGALRLAYDRAL